MFGPRRRFLEHAGDVAYQVVREGFGDLDLDQIAGLLPLLAVVDEDGAVDLGGLSSVPAGQEEIGLLGDAVDQHFDALAEVALQLPLRLIDQDVAEDGVAGVDRLARDLAVELVRRCALFARELEDADVLEVLLLDEGTELVELSVGLAWEADDEGGAQRDVRDRA